MYNSSGANPRGVTSRVFQLCHNLLKQLPSWRKTGELAEMDG